MEEFGRREISFEQAEGIVPLPSQLALKTTTRVLRARLWAAILSRVEADQRKGNLSISLGSKWEAIFRDYVVRRLGAFSDQANSTKDQLIATIRPSFEKDDYVAVLGTTEWLVRSAGDQFFNNQVRHVLEDERSAYRLVDASIVPISSVEEGEALLGALAAVDRPGFGGGRAHLLKAGSALTSGQFADSVRESIHAVESVARSLTGETSLREALINLAKKHPMHPALQKGFNSIYGYTSDANGVRHPMVGDEAAMVGEAEAVFMLGACASFVTFLIKIASN
ncbi:hypothetical protein ASF70_07495 [Rhizobium sp. Leaf321]|uniref:AbiJ-NTD4 domain-containing protein n=1 Tax=Rhizobium sp. Leaf321 TaxID=1736335 RepID=UPI0007132FBF|nr:hypothetical protein [Rhizobium sp. Leaf321]KQQ73647.1 hypothetical protein ASF70_07495 [Rhizobium sp. Leaf321]